MLLASFFSLYLPKKEKKTDETYLFRQLSIHSTVVGTSPFEQICMELGRGVGLNVSFHLSLIFSIDPSGNHLSSGLISATLCSMLLITLPHHRETDSIVVLEGWKSALRPCCSITSKKSTVHNSPDLHTHVTLIDTFVGFCIFKF